MARIARNLPWHPFFTWMAAGFQPLAVHHTKALPRVAEHWQAMAIALPDR